MKSGASDPFADDADAAADTESESPDSSARSDASEDGRPSESVEPESDADVRPSSTEGRDESDSSDHAVSNTGQFNRSDLPLTLRRENVKDERENVHQLFVQNDTDRAAKDAERELEAMLDEDLYRLDAREAIYLAGMRNLDDADAILREWGYDL